MKELKKPADCQFSDNKKKKRYELDLGDGYIALVDYILTDDGVVVLTHTEVPYEYESKGYGSELIKNALTDIRDNGREVIPQCGFVAAYVRRHPEWQDIVFRR